MKYTTETFIKTICDKFHHYNEWDFSLVNYVNNKCKVICICPNGHTRSIFAGSMLKNGNKCKVCQSIHIGEKSRSNSVEFFNKLKLKQPSIFSRYDWSKFNYIKSTERSTVICHIHGEFQGMPKTLLTGHGCMQCSIKKNTERQADNKESFLDKLKQSNIDIFNKYDFSKFEYVFSNIKSIVICPIHGEFEIRPASLLNSSTGCMMCAGNAKYTKDTFIDAVSKKLPNYLNKCSIDKLDYKCSHSKITVTCNVHGDFTVKPNNILNNNSGCPKCSKSVSKNEEKIYHYCCELIGSENVVQRYRPDFLKGREIDIFIPSKNLAIEYCGSAFHHSSKNTANCTPRRCYRCTRVPRGSNHSGIPISSKSFCRSYKYCNSKRGHLDLSIKHIYQLAICPSIWEH